MPRAAATNKPKPAGESVDARIRALPATARREALDFIDFLTQKYQKSTEPAAAADKRYWQLVGEQSLRTVWDNEEDDVYNALLKG